MDPSLGGALGGPAGGWGWRSLRSRPRPVVGHGAEGRPTRDPPRAPPPLPHSTRTDHPGAPPQGGRGCGGRAPAHPRPPLSDLINESAIASPCAGACQYDGPVPPSATRTHSWVSFPTVRQFPVANPWSEHPMAILSEAVFEFPELADEYRHLVSTQPPEAAWPRLHDYQERIAPRHSRLSEALRAERRWRALQGEKEFLDSLWRPAAGVVLDFAEAPLFEGHSLPSPLVVLEIQGWMAGTCREPLGRSLGAAAVRRAELDADLAYWRGTADELWKLLSTPVEAAPDVADVVVLDTSPCGIRRLSAVRVPRAPGAKRSSPVPESSELAAA